jgi:hypothetical protein
MLGKYKFIPLAVALFIGIVASGSHLSPVFAEPISTIPVSSVPFYPLAPCPSCSNPSNVPNPSSSVTITGSAQYPTQKVTNPTDPCVTESTSIAHDKKRWKHRHHRKHEGSVRKGMNESVKMLLELINKLIQLFGGQPIEIPNDNSTEPEENVPDENNNENPCDPEENPDVSPAPQPSAGVPQVTQVVPSTTVPSAIPSGTATTGCTQADIQKLVDSVSQTNIEKLLKALVQDDSKPIPNELISRHVSSAGNKVKTDWINQTLTGYGLQSQLQTFSGNLSNVVVTIPGTDQNTIYGAGGHFDSQSEDAENVAPGADDNGSGTVAWMEAARVLKGFQACMKSSVNLVGFNDEEEGMGGSSSYVKSVSSKAMKGFYNMDMVGYTPSGECLKTDANLSTDTPLTQKLVAMNTKYNIGLNVTTGTYNVEDIDNSSFWSANLPSSYLVECATEVDGGAYPDYHSPTDTTSNVNFAQVTKVTKLIVAALAELASQ